MSSHEQVLKCVCCSTRITFAHLRLLFVSLVVQTNEPVVIDLTNDDDEDDPTVLWRRERLRMAEMRTVNAGLPRNVRSFSSLVSGNSARPTVLVTSHLDRERNINANVHDTAEAAAASAAASAAAATASASVSVSASVTVSAATVDLPVGHQNVCPHAHRLRSRHSAASTSAFSSPYEAPAAVAAGHSTSHSTSHSGGRSTSHSTSTLYVPHAMLRSQQRQQRECRRHHSARETAPELPPTQQPPTQHRQSAQLRYEALERQQQYERQLGYHRRFQEEEGLQLQLHEQQLQRLLVENRMMQPPEPTPALRPQDIFPVPVPISHSAHFHHGHRHHLAHRCHHTPTGPSMSERPAPSSPRSEIDELLSDASVRAPERAAAPAAAQPVVSAPQSASRGQSQPTQHLVPIGLSALGRNAMRVWLRQHRNEDGTGVAGISVFNPPPPLNIIVPPRIYRPPPSMPQPPLLLPSSAGDEADSLGQAMPLPPAPPLGNLSFDVSSCQWVLGLKELFVGFFVGMGADCIYRIVAEMYYRRSRWIP